MQGLSSSVKEYYTSLVGVGLVADILPDLPLPSPVPTSLDSMVTDGGQMKPETWRVLNNCDPNLCSQVTKSLKYADTSFLKLKVAPPNQEYRPDITSPVLIKTLLKNGFPQQPRLKLKKIDLSQFGGPHSSPTHKSPSITSPMPNRAVPSSILSPLPTSDPATSMYNSPSVAATDHPLTGSKNKTRKNKLQPSEKRRKGGPSKKTKSDQMIVSIDKRLLGQTNVTKSKPLRRKSSSRKLLSSDSDEEFKLPVSISRHKLKPTKRKPLFPSSPLANHSIENITENIPNRKQEEFSLAPGVQDQRVSDGLMKKKKKKKKKHRNEYQMDNVHRAHVDRYNHLLEAILEQSDQDCLLSRQILSQLLSETAQLKQLRALHQASTELLVKIIGIMDSHILDTASLLMNEPAIVSDIHRFVPGAHEKCKDDVDVKLWREMARERILRSLDAGLVTLHITTAPNMPKHVHLEESIDLLISHTKYHLENNIYPEYDPVYRAETKESGTNAKQKRRYTSTVSKDVVAMYNRLVEVMDTLALLVDKQSLTDITILKLSSLGVLPFFVENISNLQLSSLKLVRTIFSRYEKHRDLIFEEVFASLARLPTTKKNLRSFRLSDGQSVQMLTALILQLLQCTVIPFYDQDHQNTNKEHESNDTANQSKVSLDVAVVNSYELSLRTGSNFLTTFMRKCCSGKDEDDFRPLFDNFVQDLLSTLGLPEWPASEVLLTLLGVLLLQTFSNRSNEQQLRLTSLEHLGVIAARLRKDAVSSMDENHQQIVDILAEIMQSKFDSTSPLPSPTDTQKMDAFSENSMNLQKALIAFLSHHSAADPSYTFARNFYIGQWLRDSQIDLQKGLQQCSSPTHDVTTTLSDDEDINGHVSSNLPPSMQLVQQAELAKEFLTKLGKPMTSASINSLASILDDKRAVLVNRYLASNRPLSKSFDMYLQKILRVLNDSAVHVRTRAMKTLSTIVASDPTILLRTEVQKAVHYRFSDSSTLMREAAVDLIGRFVLIQPDLTPKYYQMLLDRIRDTGVSVRRRVIKILKDICINQPDFENITNIYINMIRRMNDEEGIKQLVTGVFHQLWFTKPAIDVQQQIKQRILHITEVVSASVSEQECFELLLEELLKDNNESGLTVCQLMVDSLVERVLYLDEASDQQKSSSKLLVNCMTTLYLFSKSKPLFLVQHAKTLHPYLSTKCTSQEDNLLIHYVARILERVVPLMDRPSQNFLTSLEEDLIKLIMKQGAMIVQSCIGCLAQVVIKVTNNYSLVTECYQKFFSYLEKFQILYTQDPNSSKLAAVKPSILRSTFTVGMFCKYFNIDKILPESKQQQLMSTRVYSLLLSFCGHSDEEIKLKSLIGFGFFCVNHPELMLEKQAKDIYLSWLAKDAPSKLKLQVMKNLQTYLVEVESTLKKADASREKEETEESLMELGDRHSSVSSNIAQLYVPHILDTYYTTEPKTRLCVVQSVLLILSQGLVHPGQCVPHLIAMSTDSEQDIRGKADVQLSEYSSRFGGFMQTHLVSGLKKAYQFQQLVAELVPRGCTEPPQGGFSSSLMSHIYTLVRSSKPQRRAFLKAVLKPFEDFDQTPLGMLLFLADNLSSFPFSVIEEPLFIIHHIDMTLSVTGTSVLQSFKEALGQTGMAAADDEEEDAEKLSQETYSANINQLNECCVLGLGCVLLLILKQYVKQSYNLSDKKCQEYSPSNSNKMWDKAVTRRHGSYNPKEVVDEVHRISMGTVKKRSKEDCIRLYIHFKKLMNRLDPFEGEEDEENDGVFDNTILQSDLSLIQQQHNDGSTMNQKAISSVTPSITPKSRKRSQSRASSISSTASTRSKGKGRKRKKRKKQDSSSSDEDSVGGWETGIHVHKPATSKKKRYILSDSDSDM